LCNNANGNQHILLTVIPIEIQLIPLLIVDMIFTTLSRVSSQRLDPALCTALKKMAFRWPLAIDESDQGRPDQPDQLR